MDGRYWFWFGIAIMFCITVSFMAVMYVGVATMSYRVMDRALTRDALMINKDSRHIPCIHAQVVDARSDIRP